MADETFTTLRTTSSTESQDSMIQHRAIYAAQRAKTLFGSYRRGDANDPDAYVAAIAAVLSCYEAEIIREATDPRTGISATEKFAAFMPNAGELKQFCDAIAAHKANIKRLKELPPVQPVHARLAPAERPQGHLANVHVPVGHKLHDRLIEWSATADRSLWRLGKSSEGRDGIWVGRGIIEAPGALAKHIDAGFSPSSI